MNRYRGPVPPQGWNPHAPGYPLQGGYPPPRAVPLDPSYSGQGGALPGPGHEGGAAERIARLLEHKATIHGRPGGTYPFVYDGTAASVSNWQEIARFEGQQSHRVVVYSTYNIFTDLSFISEGGGAVPYPPPRVLLRIRIGGGGRGGASVTQMVVPCGVPVGVAGENIYVDAAIFEDEWGDIPIDPTIFTRAGCLNTSVSVFFSEGDPTITAQPTAWYGPFKSPIPFDSLVASQQVWSGPGRIKQLQGYASAANSETLWLMFFDWPGNGHVSTPLATQTPIIAFPVPPGAPFFNDFVTSTTVVSQGLFWACSDSESTFSQSVGTFFVRVERFSDLQLQGNDTTPFGP